MTKEEIPSMVSEVDPQKQGKRSTWRRCRQAGGDSRLWSVSDVGPTTLPPDAAIIPEPEWGQGEQGRAGKRLIGIVTDRDLVIRVFSEACSPDPDDLAECLDVMESRQIRRMPIVDTSGRIVGILHRQTLHYGCVGQRTRRNRCGRSRNPRNLARNARAQA
jgi:CBS-domain-containing membrane protein